MIIGMQVSVFCLLAGTACSFAPYASIDKQYRRPTRLLETPSDKEERVSKSNDDTPDMEDMLQQMKNFQPKDIDKIVAQMEGMSEAERNYIESMGMDLNVMKSTVSMMKENPEMAKSMVDVMESMTPEQLIEQSRVAQAKLKDMVQQESETTVVEMDDDKKTDDDDANDDDEEYDEEPIEPDPKVLDAMYSVAEIMSTPLDSAKQGGVSFAAFMTLPPIAVLTGNGDDDLSQKDLTESWNKGSLGATRVDRAGFERVWRLVQDFYYNDIVEEAVERTLSTKTKRRGSPKPTTTAVATTTPSLSAPRTIPTVGASISPDQLKEQVKNIKDEDLLNMFERMNDLPPEEEARMNAMGVNVEMMKKTASVMKNNPLLRKAATTMLRNAPPEELLKAGAQAQEKMANLSEEERKRLLDNL